MNDQELAARAREVGAELRRRPGDLDRLAGTLLAELADRLAGRQPGRCGDHHASGVTSCTRDAGHAGDHHNGSGLTWGSEP